MGSKQLVSTNFKNKLSSLEALRSQIMKGHVELASAYIKFAKQFTSLLDDAKQEDKANGTKTHQAAVFELGTLDGSQLTSSTVSKWRRIAAESTDLKKNQRHLPSSRDALYFIALAVGKGVRISRLVSRGQLSNKSTLTDIKRMIPTGSRDSKKTPKSRRAGATYNIGTEISTFSAIPLGIEVDRLPSNVQKLLHSGTVLLRVKVEIDPDTNRASLMVNGYGV
jgi:hypothetical protein